MRLCMPSSIGCCVPLCAPQVVGQASGLRLTDCNLDLKYVGGGGSVEGDVMERYGVVCGRDAAVHMTGTTVTLAPSAPGHADEVRQSQ